MNQWAVSITQTQKGHPHVSPALHTTIYFMWDLWILLSKTGNAPLVLEKQ